MRRAAIATISLGFLMAAGCAEGASEEEALIIFDAPANNGVAANNGQTVNNGVTVNNGQAVNNGQVAPGIDFLGGNTHKPDGLIVSTVGSTSDGLSVPKDLAFHPERPDELWVVNSATDSVTIFSNTDTDLQQAVTKSGPGASHFCANPAGLAFGKPGFLATAHEEAEPTQPSTPFDFMGPTLWTSDANAFDAGHASHYDMLHNSPNSTGIAWEGGNIYWLFDGYHNSLTRYDFGIDHGAGGSDHGDGKIYRYVEGEVSYVPGVPSGLEFDQQSNLLYVADTGNARIAVLDTTTGTRGGETSPMYDTYDQYRYNGASLTTFAAGADKNLQAPSGIALAGDLLFVSDNQLNLITAYDLDGNIVDWIDMSGIVSDGGLMGIALSPDGEGLYMVDGVAQTVISIRTSLMGSES